MITETIREAAPGVSIQHQGSTYLANWRFGVTERLAAENDYLAGISMAMPWRALSYASCFTI